MSKEDLIKWKAIEKGWQLSDLKRVNKRIHELWKAYEGSIPFEDAETLCYLLGEPISYKTEWSLIRLCKDGVIDIFEKDGCKFIDVIDFTTNKPKQGRKNKNAEHSVQLDSEYIEY